MVLSYSLDASFFYDNWSTSLKQSKVAKSNILLSGWEVFVKEYTVQVAESVQLFKFNLFLS